MAIWWYGVLGFSCIVFGGILIFGALLFIVDSGGTVEHLRRGVRAELPPKIVLPTDTLKIMCPFECTCEKHHDQKHVGIDIAPQKPDTEGDSVYAVTKGKIYVDREKGVARLECKMFHIIYRCLKTITVENGTKVKAGDTIGTMGGKETEEGVHLHIEFLESKIFFWQTHLIYFLIQNNILIRKKKKDNNNEEQ
ncbi:MAG: M23 family metallopeptidase [Eubacteriales bacterium]